MQARALLLLFALLSLSLAGAAGEKIGDFGETPVLSPVKADAPDIESEKAPRRRVRGWRSGRKNAEPETDTQTSEKPEASGSDVGDGVPVEATPDAPETCAPEAKSPTPEGVERYRARLEERLLERYNNLPEHAGNVGRVTVVLSRPLEHSMDGRHIRAEFDQIVLDIWGRRLPALEREYFVVTFGSGGAQTVRSDPSVRVGLDLEKSYSERAPLAADPFRNIDEGDAFRATPTVKMPEWWRPEFREVE